MVGASDCSSLTGCPVSDVCQIFPNEGSRDFTTFWTYSCIFSYSLNLAWIVPVMNWYTGRPTWINCVAHFTFSAPWHLEKCSLGFFFPQRSSLEWQIASCHKVENINTAQQKLRSEESDMQGGKWIRLHLILCDISSHGFASPSFQRFCWITPVFCSRSAFSIDWSCSALCFFNLESLWSLFH